MKIKLLIIFIFATFTSVCQDDMFVLASQGVGVDLLTGLDSGYDFDTNANADIGSYNGTVYGATHSETAPTNLLGSYSYDGTNDRIEIPEAAADYDAYTDNYSICMWVNSNVAGARIIEKRAASGAYPFSWLADATIVYTAVYDGSNQVLPSAGDPWDGTWHHVVMVVDQSSDKIIAYRDAILISEPTNTVTSSTDNAQTVFNLGSNGLGTGSYYSGFIGQVLFYSITLDIDQIEAIYNNGDGKLISEF